MADKINKDFKVSYARRKTLFMTMGVTNLNPDGSKMSNSRRKKRRLLASHGLNISFSRGSKLRHIKQAIRRAAKLYKRRTNATVTGENRPSCKLDEQAKSLGVYDYPYHCMNRKERKSIVSTAISTG